MGPCFEFDVAFAIGSVKDGAVEIEDNEEGSWARDAASFFESAEDVGLGGHWDGEG